MTDPIGKPVSHAKPITMTFYDRLKTYPYSTTFYVRDEANEEECHRLIEAIKAVSFCVLGKYKIGYKQYLVPNYHLAFETLNPYALGTSKWLISYQLDNGKTHQHTIPGWNVLISAGAKRSGLGKQADKADRELPVWQTFLTVFTEVCVSSDGEPITSHIDIDHTASNWPPKGWKKKNR